VQSVAIGPQRLRIAIRPGTNEAGHPPRPPFLLINGIGARLEALEPFAAAVDPAVEVIRFDPPGVGGSPLPPGPYRFTGLVRLIARLPGAGGGRPQRRLHVYPGGHLGLITEAAALAPVVDGFLAAP